MIDYIMKHRNPIDRHVEDTDQNWVKNDQAFESNYFNM